MKQSNFQLLPLKLYFTIYFAGYCYSTPYNVYKSHPKLYAEFLHSRNSSPEPMRSTEWSPLVVDSCNMYMLDGIEAPCIEATKKLTLHQYEMKYPDFQLRIPNFLTTQEKMVWINLTINGFGERLRYDLSSKSNYMVYASQTGQTFVYKPGIYTNLPVAMWGASNVCMSKSMKYDLEPIEIRNVDATITNITIIANVPDSTSIQHFLDRVTHILIQSEHILHIYKEIHSIHIFLGFQPRRKAEQNFLSYILEKFYHSSIFLKGDPLEQWRRDDHSLFNVSDVGRVKYIDTSNGILINSCHTPLIHPYHSHRLLEILEIGAHSLVQERRNIVLYLQRNHSRRVLNEIDLIGSIKKLLERRNKGEKLSIFNHSKFEQGLPQIIAWIRANVKAIIGSHGGAWFNHRWALPDTLLIEFVPKERFHIMFWEEAEILGQNYWPLVINSSKRTMHNMNVPIQSVLTILENQMAHKKPCKTHLCSVDATITKYYNWNVPGL